MNPLRPKQQRAGDPIRILIVDDSLAVRASLVGLVAGVPGIELAGTASNGAEALTLADTERPHLVLMDLNMPVMNGLSATRLLRRRHPATRIILMTASEGPEVKANCLASGADAFLSKDEICPKLEKTIVHLFSPNHLPEPVQHPLPPGGLAPDSDVLQRDHEGKRQSE